jgi:hypothetical protein
MCVWTGAARACGDVVEVYKMCRRMLRVLSYPRKQVACVSRLLNAIDYEIAPAPFLAAEVALVVADAEKK